MGGCVRAVHRTHTHTHTPIQTLAFTRRTTRPTNEQEERGEEKCVRIGHLKFNDQPIATEERGRGDPHQWEMGAIGLAGVSAAGAVCVKINDQAAD